MNCRYILVNEYWDRLRESASNLKESPIRIAALVILAVIIFLVLVAILMVSSPKDTFDVECIQSAGRDGNLVTISGTQASFDVIVKVSDSGGNAVANATVKISGGDGTASAKTDKEGMANISVSVTLEQGQQAAFLKVTVEKSGFKTYSEPNFVVVARE